jgi:hypothetical protein
MRHDDPALTANEIRSLRCVAAMMIPASFERDLPGADDETIFTDIIDSIGVDAAPVKKALQHLNASVDGTFADAEPARRLASAAALQHAGGEKLAALTRIVAQCYYRDERVMRSLGMEVRPPFPEGYEVEQGDWSLLDPVRARPAFYRGAP